MITRSLLVVLLSLPASIVMIAVMLAATPSAPAMRIPLLLAVVPLWLAVATTGLLIPRVDRAALVLLGISLGGYVVIHILKFLGVSSP